MESLQYPPELRREFRTLIADLLPELELPPTLPSVRLASARSKGGDELIVVETDYPGSRQTCLSTLTTRGALTRVLCRTWADRIVGAIQASDDDVWLGQWNEDGAWLMRVHLPSGRRNRSSKTRQQIAIGTQATAGPSVPKPVLN